jgi:hypothetical protein
VLAKARLALAVVIVTALAACASVLGIEDPTLAEDSGFVDAKPDQVVVDAKPDQAVADAPPDQAVADADAAPQECSFVPEITCNGTDTTNCANYGCACVNGSCSGGYCDFTGCSAKEAADCLECGCACVDHQCSGGKCPGSGCTALASKNCSNYGCGCVNMNCAGGACPPA